MRTPGPAIMPVPSDKIARALVIVGNLLHSIGASLLTARNEELAAELDEARAALLDLHRADVDEHQGADVDEHQGADVDEHQGAGKLEFSSKSVNENSSFPDAGPVDEAPGWLGFGGGDMRARL